ncbi:AraC family transcriptional regulator (plasmid) [Agrobacterium tumefaciens]|nr:AraC family transcriptional regulator [Agrobacterium tumefaciens]
MYKNQMTSGAGLTVLRKGSRDTFLQQVVSPASDRGFVVGVSTVSGHTRRIFHAHHVTTHVFLHDTVYIRGLAEDYKADLAGPFDFLLLELSHASLETIAQEADLPTTTLKTITAQPDPVLANLARALVPALENPSEVSMLFVDQLTAAIGTHVVQQYGDRSHVGTSKPRRLSRLQENTAKAMILGSLQGAVSVAELAQACNLSRGYFIHAFRETTGMTPYQWLQRERITRARSLLLETNASLSDVAIECGFSDQSHFTRVFSAVVGVTPGAWRRTS